MNKIDIKRSPRATEQLADLLYEIGRGYLKLNDVTNALKWLDRAKIIIYDSTLPASQDLDVADLTFNIRHTHIRACFDSEDPALRGKGLMELADLEKDNPDKLATLTLRLEVSADPFSPDPSALSITLGKTLRIVHLTPANYKLILHYISRLQILDTDSAAKILRDFLLTRIIPHGEQQWIESSIITLLWVAIGQGGANWSCEAVETAVKRIEQMWQQDMTAEPAHAALLVRQEPEALVFDINVPSLSGKELMLCRARPQITVLCHGAS